MIVYVEIAVPAAPEAVVAEVMTGAGMVGVKVPLLVKVWIV